MGGTVCSYWVSIHRPFLPFGPFLVGFTIIELMDIYGFPKKCERFKAESNICTIRKPHTHDFLGCIIYCLFEVKHFITLIFYAQSTYCLDMASAPNIVIEGEST